MKTEKHRPPRYWLSVCAGLALTAALSIGSIPLKGSQLKYIYSLIHERGPSSYLILFFGISVLLAAIQAQIRADLRPRLAVLLVLLSFTPLIWGGAAMTFGRLSVNATYNTEMASNPSGEKIKEIEQMRLIGYGVSFDPMLLSILFTIPGFILSMGLWIMGGRPFPRNKTNHIMKDIAFLRPWLAYFLTSTVISTVVGISFAIIIVLVFGFLQMSYAKYILSTVGFIVSLWISFLLYRWSVVRFVISQVHDQKKPTYHDNTQISEDITRESNVR